MSSTPSSPKSTTTRRTRSRRDPFGVRRGRIVGSAPGCPGRYVSALEPAGPGPGGIVCLSAGGHVRSGLVMGWALTWPSATFTNSWVLNARPVKPSSRLHSASSRCSTTRIAIRAIPTASIASRKSAKPTRCSRTRRSGPPMIASAMPRSSRAWAAAGAWLRCRLRLDLLRYFRRSVRHGRRPARPRFGTRARCRPALQYGNHARRSLQRQDRAVAVADVGDLRGSAPAPAPRPAPQPKTCAHCGGQGKIRHAQGFFTLERTCPICGGRGQVIENPCPTCSGSGRVTRERTLSVNIPPGVEDGTRIRLAGEGEAGRAWRSAGRSLHFPFDRRAMHSSSAMGPTCIAACRSRW